MSALRSPLPSVVAVALALAVVAGCTPTDEGPGDDPSTPPSAEPTSEPTVAPTDQPTSAPIEQTCNELVPAETLYAFSPNVAPVDDFSPSAGTFAASAVEYDGVACRFQNQSNGQNIDVSVAQLDEETLTALKNAAFEDSQMVPTYGEEAYFVVADGTGTAQVFQGPYWIVAESVMFFEPGDATEIVRSVIDGLGA